TNLVPFPQQPDAEAHAQAETERKRRLFAWADMVLQQLGLAARVVQAQSLMELNKITLDADDIKVEIELAIREALHPAIGRPAEHFASLAKGFLKGILRNRLNEKIKDRRKELLHGRTGAAGSQHSSHSWTNDLKLDAKGGIRPILANYTLFLREHPAWKGVLAYDEFSACVVIRKLPPWGDPNASWTDTPWTDHFESLTRIWFQNEDINANQGDCGRAVDAAARSNPFHPVCGRFETLDWDGNKRIDTLLPIY